MYGSAVPHRFPHGVFRRLIAGVGVDIEGYARVGVPHEILQALEVDPAVGHLGTEGVPIPYNKDKTRNPSKIKGFRACPYSFSNKNILRSRLKGGVEK